MANTEFVIRKGTQSLVVGNTPASARFHRFAHDYFLDHPVVRTWRGVDVVFIQKKGFTAVLPLEAVEPNTTVEVVPTETPCPTCNGTGTRTWATGSSGKCYRCIGKGTQSPADIARNEKYDARYGVKH